MPALSMLQPPTAQAGTVPGWQRTSAPIKPFPQLPWHTPAAPPTPPHPTPLHTPAAALTVPPTVPSFVAPYQAVVEKPPMVATVLLLSDSFHF